VIRDDAQTPAGNQVIVPCDTPVPIPGGNEIADSPMCAAANGPYHWEPKIAFHEVAAIYAAYPKPIVPPLPPVRPGEAIGKLLAKFRGRRRDVGGILLELETTAGKRSKLVIELRRGKRVISRARLASVGTRRRRVVLKPRRGERFAKGSYTLVVRDARNTLVRRRVRLR